MWQHFKDLKQTFVVSLRVEQLCQRVQQRVVTTVEDSVLHTEMENLESEEEDDPRRVLWYKPMSWLGQIVWWPLTVILCLLCRCNNPGSVGSSSLGLWLQKFSYGCSR